MDSLPPAANPPPGRRSRRTSRTPILAGMTAATEFSFRRQQDCDCDCLGRFACSSGRSVNSLYFGEPPWRRRHRQYFWTALRCGLLCPALDSVNCCVFILIIGGKISFVIPVVVTRDATRVDRCAVISIVAVSEVFEHCLLVWLIDNLTLIRSPG